MKTTHILLCFTLLLPIHINSLAEAPEAVLDHLGKQLRVGMEYYILPVVRGQGGGLTLTLTLPNKTCPLHVVQHRLQVESGLPLTFRPTNDKKGVVRVSTDYNIKFSAAAAAAAASLCAQSSPVWSLYYDELIHKYFITTGGVEGNPGIHTLSNWFKIERFEGDYKLVFCPTVCNYCKVVCKDIGILIQGGVRRLSLTDAAPFKLMFKKAASS